METLNQSDSYFRPAPSVPPPGYVAQSAGSGPPQPGSEMTWVTAVTGIGIAIGIVFAMFIVIGVALAIVSGGGDVNSDSQGLNFVASLLQDAGLVAAAVFAARMAIGQVTPQTFGFRSFRPIALLWIVVGLVAFFLIATTYSLLVHLPSDSDKVQDQLGLPLTAIFAIGIAPPVEELFFRGFLYRSFRNSWGVALGAIASGLIFGAVHVGSAIAQALPLLAVLGVILALLYEKTKSLWPCIILHAVYNSLAVLAISGS